MIRAVLNEISRARDRSVIQITFIDESGNGIARILVQDNLGATLLENNLDCPSIHTTGSIEVANDRFPLFAHSAECSSDSETEGYPNETRFELRHIIPLDPDRNPCSIPSLVREEAGTPCWYGREFVFEIAAEIEELCTEWARH